MRRKGALVTVCGLTMLSCGHKLPTWEGSELASAETSPNQPAEPGEEGTKETAEPGEEPPAEEAAEETGAAEEAPEELEKEPLPKPLNAKVDASCGKAPGVGQRVKSFKLPTPSGKSISPGNYRGRVLLLNFWGTWCEPCLKELPEFDRLYRRYRKHGLTVVAVATDEDVEAVKAFATERKLSTRMAYKGEATAGQYGARTFPFTFVVDHAGVIRAAYDGFKPGCMGKLEADIRKQLDALPE